MSLGLTYLSMLSQPILNVFKCEAAADFSGSNTSQELKLICDERGEYAGGRGLLVDQKVHFLGLMLHYCCCCHHFHLCLPAHQSVLIPGLSFNTMSVKYNVPVLPG